MIFTNPVAEKPGKGEIGIVFAKLQPGEKLHEELLIGNDPKSTSHPPHHVGDRTPPAA